MTEHQPNKVHAEDAKDIYELEDKINSFNAGHYVIATQVFPTKKGYDALIYYKDKPIENIMDKPKSAPTKPTTAPQKQETAQPNQEMATERQVYALVNSYGYGEEEAMALTKQEAFQIIKEKKKK